MANKAKKKPAQQGWPEAKKLCRLNQNDIEMAKRLGMGPRGLIVARPGPKQRWKLPVKEWIRELHFKKFSEILGGDPAPLPAVEPVKLEYDEEAARLYGEQLYWEDYLDRNELTKAPAKRKQGTNKLPVAPTPSPLPARLDEDRPKITNCPRYRRRRAVLAEHR